MTSKELNEKSYEVKISCTILRPIPEMPFWIFLNVNVLAIHTTCVVGGGGGAGAEGGGLGINVVLLSKFIRQTTFWNLLASLGM